MNRTKIIPNPNKLMNKLEEQFVQGEIVASENKSKFKGRMISMSDEFYKELNNYLKINPTEGNRSSFIVRVVADYIKNKNRV